MCGLPPLSPLFLRCNVPALRAFLPAFPAYWPMLSPPAQCSLNQDARVILDLGVHVLSGTRPKGKGLGNTSQTETRPSQEQLTNRSHKD